MFIRSLNLNLKDPNTKKMIIIIFIALSIAITLIVLALISMIKESENKNQNADFFSIKKYHLLANVRVISNKNSNEYQIEEFYLNTNEDEKFKFLTKENGDIKITYIINNNSLLVKNEDEKSEYVLSNYIINKENLLSISTFINIYNDIQLNKDTLMSTCIKLENIKTDNLMRYKITFVKENLKNHECSICNKYKNILKDGINVSKIELVYDLLDKKPLEYIVYSDNNEAIIDMNFLEFNINNNFDEKIFAF